MSPPLPQFLRLVAALRALDRPLIEIRAWPASGRRELLAALADSVPVRYGGRHEGPVPASAVKELLADAGRSSGCWFIIDGELSLASLGMAAELLSDDQCLIYAHCTDPRPPWLPVAELPPQELLLSAVELEELWINLRREPPAAGEVDLLLGATDGWYEPARWLLEQPAAPGESLQGHPFRQYLSERIWDRLPADRRDLLLELGLLDTLDTDLWDAIWRGDRAKRAMLGELSAEWGVASERPGHLRLPALLKLLLETQRRALWSAAEEQALYRQLAATVARQGRNAEALRLIAQTGDLEQLIAFLDRHRLELATTAPLGWVEQALPAPGQDRRLDWWHGLVTAARGAASTQVESLLARTDEDAAGDRRLLAALALSAVGLEPTAAQVTSGPTLFGALVDRLRGGRSGQPARRAVTRRRRYRLDLLGSTRLALHGEGGEEIELRSPLRKVFQIIAFLALAPGRRAPKQDLVEAVWPDTDREAIRKNFHPTLSAARRALQGRGGGEVILYEQGLYGLHPAYEWRVDVERFRRRIVEGRQLLDAAGEHRGQALAIWHDAWRLYRGPFLEDHDTPWIQRQRDGLQRRYLNLLRGIGDLAAELERREQALDAYRSVLFEDPFDEKVHVAVMRLYADQGRRDLVRRQYVRLQELLEELSVEPLPETQELYHQLMR